MSCLVTTLQRVSSQVLKPQKGLNYDLLLDPGGVSLCQELSIL